MARVRYTGGSVYRIRNGPTFEDGDIERVDAETAERLTVRPDFELVEDAGEVRQEDGPPDESGGHTAPAVDPGDLTVADLREAVADIDDADELRAVREAEAERDSPRTTALESIDTRLDELEG